MPACYPVQLVLQGRTCVVVGGGGVAARKAAGLLSAGARVVVVAPQVCDELVSASGCTIVRERYEPRHLDRSDLVLACTDDPKVNRQVAEDARARKLWCGVADQPELGDFFVSAVLRRGDLEVTVGTGGRSPETAGAIRRQLESIFPPAYAGLVEELVAARERISRAVAAGDARRAVYDLLCQRESIERLRDQGVEAWRAWCEQVLQGAANRKPIE